MVAEVLAMLFFLLLVLLAVAVIHGLLRAVQRRGTGSGSCQPFMERRCSRNLRASSFFGEAS